MLVHSLLFAAKKRLLSFFLVPTHTYTYQNIIICRAKPSDRHKRHKGTNRKFMARCARLTHFASVLEASEMQRTAQTTKCKYSH